MIKKIIVFAFALILINIFTLPVFAQEETSEIPQEEILEGQITTVLQEKDSYQKLEILITKGSIEKEKVEVEAGGEFGKLNAPKYKTGDVVLVSYIKDDSGQDLFYITEFVRRKPLFWLFAIFFLFALFIGRLRGLGSVLGLLFSFLIIFKFILPQILTGHEPIFIAICGSLIIVPVTFYLSHGLNKKTTVAIGGTFIALVLAGFLAKISINAANLTGFSSEEAMFLQMAMGEAINIKGLLLVGIIIGLLGVLDDITVAQAAVVSELRSANPNLSRVQLFSRAMKVGRDHIASMVNTLILVYTGASLPLLLLFINNPQPFAEVINYEIIAEEILRILVGSIGLILSVPITTFLASIFAGNK